MSWHTITHSCGHAERHQLYGPGRTRDWRAERLAAEPCDDCARAAREAENAAAAAANAAAGLPPLTGSEKQIAWAETIRAAKLDLIGRALAGALDPLERSARWGELSPLSPGIPEALDRLQAVTAAHWWIDHRDARGADLLLAVVREHPAPAPATQDPAPTAAAALAEATLRPANERTATIAEVRIDGARLALWFPEKRDDFRDLVKAKGYRWNTALQSWTRIIDERSGPLADRAADIGNALLAAGFSVRIQDPEIRAAAQAAQFQPERTRWVLARQTGKYAGWLAITWPREDDLYAAAKALPGAHYDKPAVVVPASQYAAIEDFAAAHDLGISPGARELLGTARAAHEQALLTVPARAPRRAKARGTMPPVTTEIEATLLDGD